MPARITPTPELKARIIDRIERGRTIVQVGLEPGFPTQPVISKWARADARFAAALKGAYAHRRTMRTAHLGAPSFHYDTAQAFLERVRAGETVKALVRTRPWPDEKRLRRWKVERPDFAQELEEAKRLARARRWPARRRAFDQATADKVIVTLARGVPAGRLAAEAGLPSKKVLKRWRRRDPAFDGAVASAIRVGGLNRAQARSRARLTRELAAEIVERIARGAAFAELCQAPEMPSYGVLRSWMRRDGHFALAVRQACRDREEGLLAEAYEIAAAANALTAGLARRRIAAINRRAGAMRVRAQTAGWDEG